MKSIITLFAFLFSFAQINLAQNCSAVVSTVNNGPIQIVISDALGNCFKASLQGQPLFPGYTNQITFFETDGMKKIQIEMESGEVIDKTLAINVAYEKGMFEIRKNKKDEYVVKLLPFLTETNGPSADELRIKAGKDLEAFNAKIEKERLEAEAAKAEKKRKEEEEAKQQLALDQAVMHAVEAPQNKGEVKDGSGSTSSSSSSSISVSQGNTKVRLMIMYGGKKVVGSEIEIGYKGMIIGSGITDDNGVATIYTDDLITKRIDVYGFNGGSEWSLEGLVVLDDNYYAEIDPTKLLEDMYDTYKQIETMEDMDEDEIDGMFGF